MKIIDVYGEEESTKYKQIFAFKANKNFSKKIMFFLLNIMF